MASEFRKVLGVFLIFAFVMGQISPVCAFVSGKIGQMEICSEDGSVRMIDVSARYDLSAYIDDTKNSLDKKSSHSKKNDCQFCFAQSHLSKITAANIPVLHIVLAGDPVLKIGAGSIIFKAFVTRGLQARAPPTLIIA